MKKDSISLRQPGRASLQFLGSLRATASTELRDQAKILFEEKSEAKDLIEISKINRNKTPGEWMRLVKKADKVARQESVYRFERFYQHHGGREIWPRGICAVEELRNEIEENWKTAAAKGNLDNLELNPDIDLPNYFNVEFHTQPGGWDAYDLYSAVFQYGFGPHIFRFGGYAAIDTGQRIAREEIWDAMPKNNYISIFEPGCGAGGMLLSAADRFPNAKLVGCDLSERFLRHAWRASEGANLGIHFKQCLAEDTGEPSNSYDAAISYAFFHEIPGPAAINVIREIYRILKPGGDFLLCDPPHYEEVSLFQAALLHHETTYHDEPYMTSYCATNWKTIFENIGFKNVVAKSLYNGPGKFPYIFVGTKP